MPPCVFSNALNTTKHIEVVKKKTNPTTGLVQLKKIFYEKFIATLQTMVFSLLEGTIVINKSFRVLKYMKEKFSNFLHLYEPNFHKRQRLPLTSSYAYLTFIQMKYTGEVTCSNPPMVDQRLRSPDIPTCCPSSGIHPASPEIKALPYCFKFQSK